MGHRKDEIRPGVMAEEEKFVKNITKRIIVPSERIANCDEGIENLHTQTDKFGNYIDIMKKITGVAKREQNSKSPETHSVSVSPRSPRGTKPHINPRISLGSHYNIGRDTMRALSNIRHKQKQRINLRLAEKTFSSQIPDSAVDSIMSDC